MSVTSFKCQHFPLWLLGGTREVLLQQRTFTIHLDDPENFRFDRYIVRFLLFLHVAPSLTHTTVWHGMSIENRECQYLSQRSRRLCKVLTLISVVFLLFLHVAPSLTHTTVWYGISIQNRECQYLSQRSRRLCMVLTLISVVFLLFLHVAPSHTYPKVFYGSTCTTSGVPLILSATLKTMLSKLLFDFLNYF